MKISRAGNAIALLAVINRNKKQGESSWGHEVSKIGITSVALAGHDVEDRSLQKEGNGNIFTGCQERGSIPR